MHSMNHESSKFPTHKQFQQTCLPQEFPLSISIMKHVWTNPSTPKVYQKLIQSCKLFFIKNPIVVLKNLNYNELFGLTYWNTDLWLKQKADVNKLIGKIWITKQLIVDTDNLQNITSDLILKCYRCEIKSLGLYRQILSYEELKFLLSGVKECMLSNCLIKYNNGKPMALEDIVKLFSSCRELKLCFKKYSDNAAIKNYDELISACQSLKRIAFHHIPDNFDVHKFFQHLKNNKNRTLISLHFSNFHYHIDEVIDEIFQTASFTFVPPTVDYDGFDHLKYSKMREIQENIAKNYL